MFLTLCSLNKICLFPFVFLNFSVTLTKYPQKAVRLNCVRRTVGSGKAALLWQGSRTHISRKQPLPFLSPWRVPAGSQPVLSALYCWICGWCHCGPPHSGLSLDKHTHTQNTHFSLQSAPQQTLGMETQPAADLTFILERLLRWDASSSLTPLCSSEPRGDISVFVVCEIVHSLVWKGKLELTLLRPHVPALMLLLRLHPTLAANSLKFWY